MDKISLLNDDDMKNISGGTSGQDDIEPQGGISGVNCPNCGKIVPVSVTQIIFGVDLVCPSCGEKFRIGSNENKK